MAGTAASFPPGRWRANWIWAKEEVVDDGPRHTVALRRSFQLDLAPKAAPARIYADSRYALWLNGVEIARGPVRANPRLRRFDVVDLSAYLVAGTNVLAALVTWYGEETATWLRPSPSVQNPTGVFALEVQLSPDQWLITDSSWTAKLLQGWQSAPPPEGRARRAEVQDMRSLPVSWQVAAKDTLGWPNAEVVALASIGEVHATQPPTLSRGPLSARPASPPTVANVRLDQLQPLTFVSADVVSGTVELDVAGPAGEVVEVTIAELFSSDGLPLPAKDPPRFLVVLDGDRRSIQTFDTYGLRSAIVKASELVTVHSIEVHERLYPSSGESFFLCSDPVLEQVWSAGRRTVTLCSPDTYVDCPTREQRAWTGDAVVHQMVDFATNSDWGLALWYPEVSASPAPDGMLPMAVGCDVEHIDVTVIPDWALHWIHAVHNVFRYTGDRERVHRLLSTAEGVLRWFEPFLDERGVLVDVPGWVLIDWSSVYTDGVSAALNGLWGRALLEFAEMAGWLGDGQRKRWAQSHHQALADGFEQLWDPQLLRYADNIVDDVRGRTASQHAQAAAVVGGLTPSERRGRLLDLLTRADGMVHASFSVPGAESGPSCEAEPGGDHLYGGAPPAPWWDVSRYVVRAQPFFRYVVHDAVDQLGGRDLLAGLCRDWSWALDRCATSLTETWYGGTVSHGWSATPTRDLMTRVLGVEPAEPGFAVAKIEPALGHLTSASGRIPCPAGYIDVAVTTGALSFVSPVPVVHGGKRYEPGSHYIDRTNSGRAV